MDSPPLSTASGGRGSPDSLASMDAYLASYVPLSALPTPPSLAEARQDGPQGRRTSEGLTDELAGPATHLANLVPSNACVHHPSVRLVHGFLLRAGLPLETIALAACILDELSNRFVKRWRDACSSRSPSSSRRSTPAERQGWLRRAAKLPGPEVIILSALSVAAGYHSDQQKAASYWAQYVSNGAFTARQINAAVRCMLIDIDYSLHSFGPELIEDAMVDMRRARAFCSGEIKSNKKLPDPGRPAAAKTRPAPQILTLRGTALVNGQLTPEPSPPC